ncbi:MAG TPA: glycosyltransferase, partial [Mesotoga infera]|nr:glycosyltransferase [Mesotoga infera]
MNSDKPLVSVFMITYNHEKYIAQAIESALMQKTDFNYEIVIGEDCSTDRTREIVVDYANRYPEIIKPILHENNVGAKANSESVRKACIGKYVAILEGDDYWIDPLKLQKQVDFLESHPHFSVCFTRAVDVDEEGNCL